MGLFENLFGCVWNNNSRGKDKSLQTQIIDLRNDLKKIEKDVDELFRLKMEIHNEIKRIEDKLNNHFAILTNKIHNVILILNKKS